MRGVRREYFLTISVILPPLIECEIALGDTAISHNTWIHRIVGVGVRPLANTPVTPNQVTTLRLVTGLAAAASFAVGENQWDYIGSSLFAVSVLLDRADGILARISGKTSRSGHLYDLISDGLCTSAVFVGIGYGIRESALGAWGVPLGIVAGLAVAAILWLVLRAEGQEGERAAELKGAAGFDPDDAILLVPVFILFDAHVPLIVAAAIGASCFALYFFWKFRRHLERK